MLCCANDGVLTKHGALRVSALISTRVCACVCVFFMLAMCMARSTPRRSLAEAPASGALGREGERRERKDGEQADQSPGVFGKGDR